MATSFERRPLTALIVGLLEAVQVGNPAGGMQAVKVGVGVMPLDAGWQGQPNQPGRDFVPYIVLTTQTAGPAADTGSFAQPQGDWHVPYVVQNYGVTHDQAEWMADLSRRALQSMTHEVYALGDSNYRVQQVWTGSIGAVSRVPASDPPYYMQPDSVNIWVAKRRG